MKITIIILIIALATICIPLLSKRTKTGVINNERSGAIRIAEDKIKQRFPNMIRNGEMLQLERVSPVKDRPHVWSLQYNIQKHLDSSIFIMVNVETSEVIEYQDEWS